MSNSSTHAVLNAFKAFRRIVDASLKTRHLGGVFRKARATAVLGANFPTVFSQIYGINAYGIRHGAENALKRHQSILIKSSSRAVRK